jgi:hypothetical protein
MKMPVESTITRCERSYTHHHHCCVVRRTRESQYESLTVTVALRTQLDSTQPESTRVAHWMVTRQLLASRRWSRHILLSLVGRRCTTIVHRRLMHRVSLMPRCAHALLSSVVRLLITASRCRVMSTVGACVVMITRHVNRTAAMSRFG